MAVDTHADSKTLKVGDTAPDFTLKSGSGETIHLADFRGKKNVVLAFVPFAFSGVCSAQLPSYEAELDRFNEYDAEVVSISTDSTYALNAWAKSMGTSFPLLADFFPQGSTAELYGVRHQGGFAERALFLIDKAGVIRFIEVQNSPGNMPDNENLFEAVRKL